MQGLTSGRHEVAAVVMLALLSGACSQPAAPPADPLEDAETEAAAAAAATTNPAREFGITANNAFFYYDDVERATAFYTDTLGIDLVADYDFTKVLRLAVTSYLISVDAEMGMHSTDEPKLAVLSLVTDELEAWHEYLRAQDLEF